jgi:hypothetical protein
MICVWLCVYVSWWILKGGGAIVKVRDKTSAYRQEHLYCFLSFSIYNPWVGVQLCMWGSNTLFNIVILNKPAFPLKLYAEKRPINLSSIFYEDVVQFVYSTVLHSPEQSSLY